jgi:cell division protein FtsB
MSDQAWITIGAAITVLGALFGKEWFVKHLFKSKSEELILTLKEQIKELKEENKNLNEKIDLLQQKLEKHITKSRGK